MKNFLKRNFFFILSSIYCLLSSKRIKTPEVKNILIISLSKIGDTVVILPTIKMIRDYFKLAHISWVISPLVYDLIKNNLDVDEKILFRRNLEFIKKIRRVKYDLAIVLDLGFLSNLIAYISKAEIRLGYNYENQGFLLNRSVKAPSYYNKPIWKYKNEWMIKHQIESWLELVKTIGIHTDNVKAKIFVSPEDQNYIEDILSQKKEFKIIFHPGSYPSYRWNEQKWGELGNKIIQRYNALIIITGSKKDLDIGKKIEKIIKDKPLNLVGKTTLGQLAALIGKVDLLISVDTSATHIASAMDTKVIALFGPGDPKIWAPYGENNIVIQKKVNCFGCKKPKCFVKSHYCMDAITVDDVLEAVEKLI